MIWVRIKVWRKKIQFVSIHIEILYGGEKYSECQIELLIVKSTLNQDGPKNMVKEIFDNPRKFVVLEEFQVLF